MSIMTRHATALPQGICLARLVLTSDDVLRHETSRRFPSRSHSQECPSGLWTRPGVIFRGASGGSPATREAGTTERGPGAPRGSYAVNRLPRAKQSHCHWHRRGAAGYRCPSEAGMAERGRTSWSPSLSALSPRPSPLARQPPGSSGTRKAARRDESRRAAPVLGRRSLAAEGRLGPRRAESGASRTLDARVECCLWLRSILLSSGWCTTDARFAFPTQQRA
jgi:hypothetical protein